MINKVQFEGINKGIVFENNQILKFKLENIGNSKKNKTALITCFKEEYFNKIRENKEKTILIDGEFYESNYQDKKGNWINTYCINMSKLTIR